MNQLCIIKLINFEKNPILDSNDENNIIYFLYKTANLSFFIHHS